MEDSSSYEKVKHEKQRRNMYCFWSVCIYIHVSESTVVLSM